MSCPVYYGGVPILEGLNVHMLIPGLSIGAGQWCPLLQVAIAIHRMLFCIVCVSFFPDVLLTEQDLMLVGVYDYKHMYASFCRQWGFCL